MFYSFFKRLLFYFLHICRSNTLLHYFKVFEENFCYFAMQSSKYCVIIMYKFSQKNYFFGNDVQKYSKNMYHVLVSSHVYSEHTISNMERRHRNLFIQAFMLNIKKPLFDFQTVTKFNVFYCFCYLFLHRELLLLCLFLSSDRVLVFVSSEDPKAKVYLCCKL